MTPDTLARHNRQMVDYGEGAPTVRVVTTIVVMYDGSRPAIRSIEWGRP